MNFGNLKTLSRKYCPELKTTKLSDTELELIINNGALDLARRTACLPKNATFDVVADTKEYYLSAEVTDFLVMRPSGLWWYNGSKWVELDPKTLKWLDENLPNWRSASSGDPFYYVRDNDELTIHPTPDTGGTGYFKAYYGKKPRPMTKNSHYPFGYTVEIPHLSPYHELILQYVKWKGLYIIGSKDDYSLAKREYKEDVAEMKVELQTSPELEEHEEISMDMANPIIPFK